MNEKLVQIPLGIYSYNPRQALDLIKTKPNAFLVLGLIAFILANNPFRSGLGKYEIYFKESDLKTLGHKPILSRSQLNRALENLVKLGFIHIRPHSIRGIKIIELLANPFVCLGGVNGR